MIRKIIITFLAFLLLLAPPVLAGTSDTVSPIPTSGSSFMTDLQNFLRNEDANRFREQFQSFVYQGGTHATGSGLTKTPSSLIAYPGGFRATETGSITYPDNATCWVIVHKDITGNAGTFSRVAGTHYLRDCTSITIPALPANSAYLMKVTTASGAVTVVNDLRSLSPFGGGTYTPQIDGNNQFKVMTPGSTATAASNQGLRAATWSFFDTKTDDVDNAIIKVDVLSTSNPLAQTIKKTGIHVNQFSLPDNGGETSAILALQTGGGNAISAFRFTSLRPAGTTNFLNNGFALEAGADNSTAVALFQIGHPTTNVGSNIQGAIFNLNSTTAKGIVVQPTVGSFDSRMAYEVAQYVQGSPNATRTWSVTLSGNQAQTGDMQVGGNTTITGSLQTGGAVVLGHLQSVAGVPAISTVVTVRDAGGATDCAMTFTEGILTATTC